MPESGTRSPGPLKPLTARIVPADATAIRCFPTDIGECSEVEFQALDDNGQVNAVTVGDSLANATLGAARGTGIKPGGVKIERKINPFEWYTASQGDGIHGMNVTAKQ